LGSIDSSFFPAYTWGDSVITFQDYAIVKVYVDELQIKGKTLSFLLSVKIKFLLLKPI
jgi:hypothetical protein